MIFHETGLCGARLIEAEVRSDERGSFARIMCQREFEENDLNANFVQQNTSTSAHAGTIRGVHFQLAPHTEAKFVRCIRGAVLDIIIDLRRSSPTFMRHAAFELSAANYHMLYVPEGFGHSFQTLVDDCEVTYLVTASYAPEAERGLRFSDPRLRLEWPLPVSTISPKDASWPLLGDQEPQFFD